MVVLRLLPGFGPAQWLTSVLAESLKIKGNCKCGEH